MKCYRFDEILVDAKIIWVEKADPEMSDGGRGLNIKLSLYL